MESFWHDYRGARVEVRAAGLICWKFNKEGKVTMLLMIENRDGVECLSDPGGKISTEDSSVLETASREFSEELGIEQPQMLDSFDIYSEGAKYLFIVSRIADDAVDCQGCGIWVTISDLISMSSGRALNPRLALIKSRLIISLRLLESEYNKNATNKTP
jgi:8-oxo-dGTP pyrophosphatase MutT (NUDIX family)